MNVVNRIINAANGMIALSLIHIYPFIIEGNTVEISAKDFKRIDARGNSYEFSDNRIELSLIHI